MGSGESCWPSDRSALSGRTTTVASLSLLFGGCGSGSAAPAVALKLIVPAADGVPVTVTVVVAVAASEPSEQLRVAPLKLQPAEVALTAKPAGSWPVSDT